MFFSATPSVNEFYNKNVPIPFIIQHTLFRAKRGYNRIATTELFGDVDVQC